jgi:hypothetical protein
MENKMNGYVCIYNNQRIELYANSSYSAQELAVTQFQKGTRKKVKGYNIIVVLCEIDGEQVVHSTSF